MCERVDNKVNAEKSPIGLLPREADIDLTGLNIPSENMKELMQVDLKEWRAEIPDIKNHFATFGNRLPERLKSSSRNSRHVLDKIISKKSLVNVLGVVYAHTKTSDGGDLYLTRFAEPYEKHFEIENWHEKIGLTNTK